MGGVGLSGRAASLLLVLVGVALLVAAAVVALGVAAGLAVAGVALVSVGVLVDLEGPKGRR